MVDSKQAVDIKPEAETSDTKHEVRAELVMNAKQKPAPADQKPVAVDKRPSPADHKPAVVDGKQMVDHRPASADHKPVAADTKQVSRVALETFGTVMSIHVTKRHFSLYVALLMKPLLTLYLQ